MVSIIIPSYNYEKYLARAIESALDQDFQDKEVIVVDDGSTDASFGIAESYVPRIKLIRQANQGLAAARNTGIADCKGEYIIFLDADDWMEKNAISQMLQKFEQLTEEFGVIACHQTNHDKHGNLADLRKVEAITTDIEVYWQDLVLPDFRKRFLPFALIKRVVFERCGVFDSTFGQYGSEDREFFMRVCRVFRICRIPGKLLNYTIHGENMSTNPYKQLPGMLKCLDAAVKSNVRPWWHFSFWAKVYAYFHYQASGMYRDLPNNRKALFQIVMSLIKYPLSLSRHVYGHQYLTRVKRLMVCLRDSLKKTRPQMQCW